jgi:hypothetical protein
MSRFQDVSILPIVVSFLTVASASGGASDSTLARVRSTEHAMSEIIRTGAARSPTFRHLVQTLERSDLIVYVEPSKSVDGGYLRFATVAGQSRWVQVFVNPKRPINQILAMIGHELQHAIEISDAPSVVDEATMAGLYRRIGVKSCGNSARACYETTGAQVTGAAIFRELSGRSVPPDGLACALR